MHSDLSRLSRWLAVLAAPVALLIVLYLVLDPFQVIRTGVEPEVRHGIAPNREMMNTQMLLRRPDAARYDAFIFGNSRSLAYQCRDWLQWIAPANPFHYDALGETLLGLRGKLRLLERQGMHVRQALLIVDPVLLSATDDPGNIVTIKHPAVSEGSRIRFQAVFLRAFFSDLFVIKYLDYRLFGTFRPYMRGVISSIPAGAYGWDPQTNDVQSIGPEKEIAVQPDQYFANLGRGTDRTPRDEPPVIGARQLEMLREVRASLNRQRTNYQIVVSPDFARARLNPADVLILHRLFGAERVHDFSRDPDLGLDIRDWYDTSHYRPTVALEVMRRVYAGRTGSADVIR